MAPILLICWDIGQTKVAKKLWCDETNKNLGC